MPMANLPQVACSIARGSGQPARSLALATDPSGKRSVRSFWWISRVPSPGRQKLHAIVGLAEPVKFDRSPFFDKNVELCQ